MAEYGHDIGNMKAFADEELTLELDMRSIPKESLQKILGAIPIVRCKDCIWYESAQDSYCPPHCMNRELKTWDGRPIIPDPDFFCAYGERA